MAILPTGFSLPPLPYLVVLVAALLVVLALLLAVEPRVSQRVVIAFAPWMAVGGGLHAFYQLGAYDPVWAPLFGAPAVYVTTFVIASGAWLLLTIFGLTSGPKFVAQFLTLSGLGILTVVFVLAFFQGVGLGSADLVWPLLTFVIAVAITGVAVLAIGLWRTPVFIRTRLAGTLVIFAHAMDGVSTAVGADVYDVHERTPLPRLIMDTAGQLPTADAIGVGWLFVLVKVAIAALLVVAFNRTIQEDPFWGNILFGVLAAVGLGPATNNLVLFVVGSP